MGRRLLGHDHVIRGSPPDSVERHHAVAASYHHRRHRCRPPRGFGSRRFGRGGRLGRRRRSLSRGSVSRRATGTGSGSGGSSPGPDGLLHVGAGYAAPQPGPFDGGRVDSALRDQPAHDRGQDHSRGRRLGELRHSGCDTRRGRRLRRGGLGRGRGAGGGGAAGSRGGGAGGGSGAAGGGGGSDAAGTGAAASEPRRASTWPTSTRSPSLARISESTPATGEGTSVSTLSVDTSNSASSRATSSPTCLNHRVTVPSVTVSPSWGIVTSTMEDLPCGVSRAASARSGRGQPRRTARSWWGGAGSGGPRRWRSPPS